VYEVEWKGRKYAKKTFYGLAEFQDEVSMLEKLSHPHIMSLLYSGRDKNSCFLVMDLMDGDLFTIMQERQNKSRDVFPFPILIAVDIMHQVAEGVNYLHENNIVHRDLKAGNILVKHVEQTNSGIGNALARVAKYVPSIAKYFKYKKGSELETKYLLAKVADFGLAKIKMKSKMTSEQDANVGTSRYMAPEIINLTGRKLRRVRGEKCLPFKCDVYSFAMLCYEVWTGNKPFPNVYYDKDVKKMVLNNKRPELPQPYCLPELIALITKCWDKTPNKHPKFETICEELECLKASLKKGLFFFS
jgi:serine/threonine protein kinase